MDINKQIQYKVSIRTARRMNKQRLRYHTIQYNIRLFTQRSRLDLFSILLLLVLGYSYGYG